MANAAARMMSVYQDGLLTLQKLRTGGNQTVTVQHVNVQPGAQAVIGNVRTQSGSAPRKKKPTGNAPVFPDSRPLQRGTDEVGLGQGNSRRAAHGWSWSKHEA